jgi:hypothetical protein
MAFTFRLVTGDGAPVDPPTFRTVAPLRRVGDTIALGRRTFRVVDVRLSTRTMTTRRYSSSRTCPDETSRPSPDAQR